MKDRSLCDVRYAWSTSGPYQSLGSSQRTAELSPLRGFDFSAACARSTKIAAAAKHSTPRCSGQRSHSSLSQHRPGAEFPGRRKAYRSNSAPKWLLCADCSSSDMHQSQDTDIRHGPTNCTSGAGERSSWNSAPSRWLEVFLAFSDMHPYTGRRIAISPEQR